jgi:hypothetical protein
MLFLVKGQSHQCQRVLALGLMLLCKREKIWMEPVTEISLAKVLSLHLTQSELTAKFRVKQALLQLNRQKQRKGLRTWNSSLRTRKRLKEKELMLPVNTLTDSEGSSSMMVHVRTKATKIQLK